MRSSVERLSDSLESLLARIRIAVARDIAFAYPGIFHLHRKSDFDACARLLSP